MRVTVAGNMGRAIGTRAVAGGNEVEILDRNPADTRALAEELGDGAAALDPGSSFVGDTAPKTAIRSSLRWRLGPNGWLGQYI